MRPLAVPQRRFSPNQSKSLGTLNRCDQGGQEGRPSCARLVSIEATLSQMQNRSPLIIPKLLRDHGCVLSILPPFRRPLLTDGYLNSPPDRHCSFRVRLSISRGSHFVVVLAIHSDCAHIKLEDCCINSRTQAPPPQRAFLANPRPHDHCQVCTVCDKVSKRLYP